MDVNNIETLVGLAGDHPPTSASATSSTCGTPSKESHEDVVSSLTDASVPNIVAERKPTVTLDTSVNDYDCDVDEDDDEDDWFAPKGGSVHPMSSINTSKPAVSSDKPPKVADKPPKVKG